MSRGTPITTVRLPACVKSACDVYLAERKANRSCDVWSTSDLIIHALRDYLRWVVRSRKRSAGALVDGAELAELVEQIEGIIVTNPDKEKREE